MDKDNQHLSFFTTIKANNTYTKPCNISSVWQKSDITQLFRKQELYSNIFVLTSQLYFKTSKFEKNSRPFPGFLEFENI